MLMVNEDVHKPWTPLDKPASWCMH